MNEFQQIYQASIDSFLRPLDEYFADESISEIMVHSSTGIFVERQGRLEQVCHQPFSERRIRAFLQSVAELNGQFIEDHLSSYQGTLPKCGSRFHCIWPPATSDHAFHLTIRKHRFGVLTLTELRNLGAITEAQFDRLSEHVANQSNIIISGETGTGKTTFLNALLEASSKTERIVVIEEIPEIEVRSHVNKAMLRTVPPGEEGVGEKSIRDLVRESLIMRPDRIILGECRGLEAVDMIQAMQTHRGCLATLHGRSVDSARYRLETLMLQAQKNYSTEIVSREIKASIDVFVQLARNPDGQRYVSEIRETAEL